MDFTSLIILLLLPAPPEWTSPPAGNPVEWQTLKITCHLLDLYQLGGNWAENYASEVAWAQTQFQRTYNSPPLSDAERLPPLKVIEEAILLNEAHQRWLEAHWGRGTSWEWLDRAEQQNRHLHQWWVLARTARSSSPYLISRRAALAEIRGTYGPDRFHVGDWPPPFYLWGPR